MVSDKPITDLVDCVEREIRQRHYVYERRVAAGKMTKQKMDHEIRCMEQILVMLRAEAKKGMLL